MEGVAMGESEMRRKEGEGEKEGGEEDGGKHESKQSQEACSKYSKALNYLKKQAQLARGIFFPKKLYFNILILPRSLRVR
jgi:hypothetical protein